MRHAEGFPTPTPEPQPDSAPYMEATKGFDYSVDSVTTVAGVLTDDLMIDPADIITALLATALAMADDRSSHPFPVQTLHSVLDDLNKMKIQRN